MTDFEIVKLKEIISHVGGWLSVSELNMEDGLFTDLGFDSLDMLDLIYKIEMEYKLKLPRSSILVDGDLDENNNLTKTGVNKLFHYFPDLINRVHEGSSAEEIMYNFTTTSIINLIDYAREMKIKKIITEDEIAIILRTIQLLDTVIESNNAHTRLTRDSILNTMQLLKL